MAETAFQPAAARAAGALLFAADRRNALLSPGPGRVSAKARPRAGRSSASTSSAAHGVFVGPEEFALVLDDNNVARAGRVRRTSRSCSIRRRFPSSTARSSGVASGC